MADSDLRQKASRLGAFGAFMIGGAFGFAAFAVMRIIGILVGKALERRRHGWETDGQGESPGSSSGSGSGSGSESDEPNAQ